MEQWHSKVKKKSRIVTSEGITPARLTRSNSNEEKEQRQLSMLEILEDDTGFPSKAKNSRPSSYPGLLLCY